MSSFKIEQKRMNGRNKNKYFEDIEEDECLNQLRKYKSASLDELLDDLDEEDEMLSDRYDEDGFFDDFEVEEYVNKHYSK